MRSEDVLEEPLDVFLDRLFFRSGWGSYMFLVSLLGNLDSCFTRFSLMAGIFWIVYCLPSGIACCCFFGFFLPTILCLKKVDNLPLSSIVVFLSTCIIDMKTGYLESSNNDL